MCLTMARPRPVPPNSRLRALIDAVETLEKPWQIAAFDPAAVVPDANDHLVRLASRLDADRRARAAVLDRIVQQVDDRLFEQIARSSAR